MDTDETRIKEGDQAGLLHHNTTETIIGAAFNVHSTLGYGFLERVYQRSMQVELCRIGRKTELEFPITVKYKGVVVGEYVADLWVDECVIVELKIAPEYNKSDEAQLLNELKATGVKVGILINFGRSKVEFKRFVF